ncbi:MAG: exodeoxyribonuclease V subunit gamma [Candidatus Sericytochromatia bacterium]
MHLFLAARLDALLPRLWSWLAPPLRDPLQAEWIVAERPVRAWLERAWIREHGVLAHVRWLTPEEAERQLRDPAGRCLSAAALTWPIVSQLQALQADWQADLPVDPAWHGVLHWLAGEGPRLWPLAERLAELFERYRLWQPERLLTSPDGLEGAARWQALLWQGLQAQLGERLLGPFRAAAEPPTTGAAGPERLLVVGWQVLAPGWLSLLQSLSQTLPIQLLGLGTPEDHPWSARLGQQAAWQRAAFAAQGLEPVWLDADTPTASPFALHFQSCAGPQRELEAVRDAWLELCTETSRPEEWALLMPDPTPYLPYLAGVFGREGPLPLRVQVLGQAPDTSLREALSSLFALSGGRLALPEVLAWLELPPVAARWQLDAPALALCRHWLEAVQVRWGRDASHRARVSGHAFAQNSWQNGLRRLLLGYALSDQSAQLYAGLLPHAGLEGSLAQVLGQLLEALDTLFELSEALSGPRTLTAWAELLGSLPERCLRVTPAQHGELQLLYQSFDGLRDVPCEAPVSLAWVRSWLQARWREAPSPYRLGDALSVGALSELGLLPWRHVAVLGLQDQAFPRRQTPLEFDLLPLLPEPGGLPGVADAERQALLQVLWSTEGSLRLSWSGQRLRDGAELPPALAVAELLEERGLLPQQVQCPLSPYDARLFAAPRPVSAEADTFAAVQVLHGQASAPRLVGLPSPTDAEQALSAHAPAHTVELGQLLDFWRAPVAWHLREKLNLRPEGEAAEPEAAEPFAADALTRYGLHQQLLEAARRGDDLADYVPVLRASGRLPVAEAGELALETLIAETRSFASQLNQVLSPEQAPQRFAVSVGPWRLQGQLLLAPTRLELVRNGPLRAQDRLQAWIQHLVFCLLTPAAQTCLLGRPGKPGKHLAACHFPPQADAAGLLEALLTGWAAGQAAPLPFFPASSLAYAEALAAQKSPALARLAAAQSWGSAFGEGRQPAQRLCYGEQEPFDAVFAHWAQTIAGPLAEVPVHEQ